MPTGELAALGTACCWAATGIFFAGAADRIGALRLNLLRLPMALVMLSVLLAVTRTVPFGVGPGSVALLALSGLVGLVAGDLAFFGALIRLGPRLSSLLMSLAPIFAAVAGLLLLGERPGPYAALGIVLTLSGSAWVVAERRPASGERKGGRGFVGPLLGVTGAACQGVGLVLAKMGMAGGVAPLPATWIRMATATVAIWALAALSGQLIGLGLAGALRRAFGFVLGGAFFGPTVGVWLSLIAARLTDVAVAATIMATTPVLILPLVMATERYRPSARAVIGTVAAVAGVALLFSR